MHFKVYFTGACSSGVLKQRKYDNAHKHPKLCLLKGYGHAPLKNTGKKCGNLLLYNSRGADDYSIVETLTIIL